MFKNDFHLNIIVWLFHFFIFASFIQKEFIMGYLTFLLLKCSLSYWSSYAKISSGLESHGPWLELPDV